MARGRGQTDQAGIRINPVLDILGFKAQWNLWTADERHAYVWPQNLDYADLSGLDLSGCDLSNRSMYGVNFFNTDLRVVNLEGSDVRDCIWTGASINFDDLDHAQTSWIDDEDRDRVFDWPADRERYSKKSENLIHEWDLPNGGTRRITYVGQDAYKKAEEVWFNDKGQQHRESGPALRVWWPNGNLSTEAFKINGEDHCNGHPARTTYHKNGTVARTHWRQNGKLHREGGPAVVYYDLEGKITRSEDWIRGEFVKNNLT